MKQNKGPKVRLILRSAVHGGFGVSVEWVGGFACRVPGLMGNLPQAPVTVAAACVETPMAERW